MDAPQLPDEEASSESELSPSQSPAVDEAAVATAASTAPELPAPIRRPKPEDAKINKCIKEWQVGAHRVGQLVHWLCDPFGDNGLSGDPPAVLSTMPSLPKLNQGDQVIGVVVGVMPFGVFVELAPDCSGLIHVSKVSDGFVEDLHEAVQVGDVVTAWVAGVDEKRRRVALSAVSPQREAELQQARNQRDTRGDTRGGDRHPRAAQQPRRDQRDSAPGQSRGTRPATPARSGGGAGGGRGGRGDARGGRSRDSRDGGRSRGREKKPESYRVVSKEPAKPITDAMQKGVEPMRSFGDLLQFYSKDEKQDSGAAQPKQTTPSEQAKSAQAHQANAIPGIEPQPDTVAAKPESAEAAKPDAEVVAHAATMPQTPATETSDAESNIDDAAVEMKRDDGETKSSPETPPAPSDAPSS